MRGNFYIVLSFCKTSTLSLYSKTVYRKDQKVNLLAPSLKPLHMNKNSTLVLTTPCEKELDDGIVHARDTHEGNINS